jgi:HSP20 family protein
MDGSPWRELREIQAQMDRVLSTALRGERAGVTWSPAVDIAERDDALVLTAELPGMSRDDIEVELENNVLTIRGEKKDEREEKEEDRYVYEREFGAFARSFTLPRTVDADRIHARFENGVLTVTMPKSERARGRRIDVEEGRGDGG